MKKNQSCNALKVLKIVRIILSIILLSYTLSVCIIGHCASAQDYFPMEQNKNGNIPDNILTYIENNFNEQYYYICYYEKKEENSFTPGTYYYYYMLVGYNKQHGENPLYCEINNDLIHFSLYNNSQNGLLFRRLSYFSRTPNNITASNTGSLSNWQNLISSNYNTSKDYVSNFTVYTSNNTSSRKIVLLSDGDIYIPEGDTAPEDMEKPNIQDYIPDWTNRPAFDGTSVENALQSVYNGVLWFGDNVKGTISGTGQYISDTLRWSVQKTINNLRDISSGIQEKINDVKNAILTTKDKIQGFFDYVSQSYDTTKVNSVFNNMTIKTDYNNLTTLVNNAFSVFDATAEPNTFQIPIHLERIPILHVQTVQYIDLGWLYDCRGIIRAFIWCVTTFGLLYTIIDSLPNYLSGNDE